uniref:Uncharacterized protein n=1 Tax=Cannabis sativa TaxID=3483 RepID=A0A803QPD5_CANSA
MERSTRLPEWVSLMRKVEGVLELASECRGALELMLIRRGWLSFDFLTRQGRLELTELGSSTEKVGTESPRSLDLGLGMGFTMWKLLGYRCEKEKIVGLLFICMILKREREQGRSKCLERDLRPTNTSIIK